MWRNAGIVVVGALATAQGDGATLMVTLPPGAIDAVEGPVEVWDDLTGGCVVARSIELDVLVCTQVRVDLTASRIGRPIVYKGANGFSIAISKSGELQVCMNCVFVSFVVGTLVVGFGSSKLGYIALLLRCALLCFGLPFNMA